MIILTVQFKLIMSALKVDICFVMLTHTAMLDSET